MEVLMGLERVRAGIVGAGGFARYHLRLILEQQDTTEIVVICEPSPAAYAQTAEIFVEAGLQPPPNEPDLTRMLATYAGKLDVAFVITPHACHHDQVTQCLEAGLDVLVEKPMVINAAEAESLIETRDRTNQLLVVSFQGGLSPQVREAVRLLRSGEIGELLNISATVWQYWRQFSQGTWRMQPELSGGGFMFDTGAHALNTICDLAGEDFVEVAAWLDNRGEDVDILGAVMGRLESGGLVTINACGDTVKTCASEIMVFTTEAILRTTMWGSTLKIQRQGSDHFEPVELPPSKGAWEQFIQVRRGEIPNPCPPEVGLRMARLWDAIQASAAQKGTLVQAKS
jgi:predicted dehydrogenase